MLPPKLESVGPRAEVAPKQSFGRRHRAAKLPRLHYVFPRRSHAAFPSTMLRMVPLPAKSRGGLQAGSFSRAIAAIFSLHTKGAMWWTLWPSAVTATVTGMSSTANS